jgi:carbon-monoxide dehydrogenase medium subunit
MLALRLARFDHLVDLNRISELRGIELIGNELVIGSLTRQSAAEHSDLVTTHVPLLARALPKIGHFQIRNRGTIGGSIAHADPASELPATALCLDATITLAGPKGARDVAARDFFISVWQTAAEPDEIVTRIRFPVTTPQSGYAIEEFALRTGDFAITGVTCAIRLDGSGNIHHAALAYMGMGPTPLRARVAEEALLGTPATTVNLEEIAQQATTETAPSDDVHASAGYRTRVATQLTIDALRKAIEEASRG